MYQNVSCWQDAPSCKETPLSPPFRPDRNPLRARLLDALLTTEREQRIRLAMTGLAAVLMLCCMGAMYLAVASGLTPARPVHWWALACCSGLLLVYALIRSGYSRRWQDPAMTMFQNLTATGAVAVAYVIAGAARGIVLPIVAVILMFGIFGLQPRQMRILLVCGLAMFGTAISWVQWGGTQPAPPLALSAAYMLMIAVVLVAGTTLSLRIQAVRSRLHQQRNELSHAVDQVRQLATRDELTGLPNRRHLNELLHERLQHARHGGPQLQLALLDLDHFKAVNDTHGHAAGDEVLRIFARTIASGVRCSDTVARWGGEEFILLMTETAPADGARLLDRLRERVAALALQLPTGTARLTFSTGVACLRPGEGAQELLRRADEALYQAKASGRDQVVWAAGDAPE